MTKYLISRLLLVFLFKFFISWASNTYKQCSQFFDFNPTSNFIFKDLPVLLSIAVIVLGIIVINLIYLLFHLSEEYSFSRLIHTISEVGIVKCVKKYFLHFWGILSSNFNHQVERELYPKLFLIFVLFYVPFIKGNPFLNNYYGIYKEYEVENPSKSGETTNYVEEQMFIIPKERNDINLTVDLIRGSNEDDEPYFDVKKRGYLFLQAGIIDGFQSYNKNYKGIIAYIRCLLFSVLEKLINSILYFLIPFIIAITIYHYKFEKNSLKTDSLS